MTSEGHGAPRRLTPEGGARFAASGICSPNCASHRGFGTFEGPNLGVLAQRRGRLLRQAHRRRLKRGVLRALVDLQVAINRFLAETNSTPKPFVSTADPKRVLAAFKRGKEALESIHKQSRKSAFKISLSR